MANYMRRRKTSLIPSLGGVLTRAKTLALQKASYLQLRSRRLVKPNSPCLPTNPNKLRALTHSAVSVKEETESKNLGVGDEEGSNTLEIQGSGRTTRETTPCSLIKDPDTIKTPGSSTKSRRPTKTKYRVPNTTPKPIPSTREVDEFFMGPEKQQQRLFIEKYNFDPVNDKPLHGRYEWVKLDALKKS